MGRKWSDHDPEERLSALHWFFTSWEHDCMVLVSKEIFMFLATVLSHSCFDSLDKRTHQSGSVRGIFGEVYSGITP